MRLLSTRSVPTKAETFHWTSSAKEASVVETDRQFETLEKEEKPLQNEKFFKFDPSEVDPWKGLMVRNSPGHAPAGAPVFIAQGTADTTVDPQVTKGFAEALCKQGVQVMFVELPGVSHIFAARDSAPAALRWMNDRFRGAPAPSVCQR
jgi:acetyl esterase/lipase